MIRELADVPRHLQANAKLVAKGQLKQATRDHDEEDSGVWVEDTLPSKLINLRTNIEG